MVISEWQDSDAVLLHRERFDALEIQGVRDDEWGASCEIDNRHPQYFTVFAHLISGGVESIGDFRRYRVARAFAEELSEKTNFPLRDFTESQVARLGIPPEITSPVELPNEITSPTVRNLYQQVIAQYGGAEFLGAGGLPIRYAERDPQTLQISNVPSNPIDNDLWVDIDLRHDTEEDLREALICRFQKGLDGSMVRRYERIPMVEADAFEGLLAGDLTGLAENVVPEPDAMAWRARLSAQKTPSVSAEMGVA